jgi:putative ABC transport system permease protein
MRSLLRQFRRAPGRIIASVFALALAVGAIGVLAIPSISGGTLHDAAVRDGLADIIVPTSSLDDRQIAEIAQLANVKAAEGQAVVAVRMSDGSLTRLIGLDADSRTMDLVHLDAGRQATGDREVVASPAIGAIGDQVRANDIVFTIVGHGSTLWWSDSDVLYSEMATAQALLPEGGSNTLVITAHDDDEESLRAIVDDVRRTFDQNGETLAELPFLLPDGSTPIDQDIEQVSGLIGLLGIFSGFVALVLLASTTNTLITERTREVAVMRALGGRSRALRRRLRRIALGITGAALVVGLPLGIVISNMIARMVVEEFVGITPDLAIDWRVLVGSAIGTLIGARIVAARAARRVVTLPLAEALRDREGAPYGRGRTQRLLTRIPTGGLFGRLAVRSSMHRPARTIAVVVQISAAVGAAFLIPSLASSVNEYNTASTESWTWESQTEARNPGLPFETTLENERDGVEAGVYAIGEIADLEVDVFGLSADPEFLDLTLSQGRWIDAGNREAVVSAGFAGRSGIDIGERLDVELAAGAVEYTVVGLADDYSRSVYVGRTDLATDLGSPGMANVLWSDAETPGIVLAAATSTSTRSDIAAEDAAGRDAIVVIFGAIGLVVAGVAALAVISSMTVSLYERRHEFATLQALGARRRRLRGLLFRELLPVGAAGIVGGLVLGGLGTRGIIGSFEASNAIDIGVVDAVGTIPFIAVGTLVVLALLSTMIVRTAGRRPVAETLRGAA